MIIQVSSLGFDVSYNIIWTGTVPEGPAGNSPILGHGDVFIPSKAFPS